MGDRHITISLTLSLSHSLALTFPHQMYLPLLPCSRNMSLELSEAACAGTSMALVLRCSEPLTWNKRTGGSAADPPFLEVPPWERRKRPKRESSWGAIPTLASWWLVYKNADYCLVIWLVGAILDYTAPYWNHILWNIKCYSSGQNWDSISRSYFHQETHFWVFNGQVLTSNMTILPLNMDMKWRGSFPMVTRTCTGSPP